MVLRRRIPGGRRLLCHSGFLRRVAAAAAADLLLGVVFGGRARRRRLQTVVDVVVRLDPGPEVPGSYDGLDLLLRRWLRALLRGRVGIGVGLIRSL